MIRATAIVRRPAVRAEKVTDEIFLDHKARQRRRFAFTAEGGTQFLLDLERATMLDDGDAVKLEDGRLVRVNAAPEALVEVTTPGPLRLLKVAWHLGNRHVATEVTEKAVYFPEDPALAEVVRGLGVSVARVTRPFRPEKGAAEAAEAHGGHDHDHGHGHGHHAHGRHDHDHHDHEHHDHHHHDHHHHDHAHQAHAHHDHACGCGHDHEGHAEKHRGEHSHGHDAGSGHAHHDHDHGTEGHVHGPECGHGHKHG